MITRASRTVDHLSIIDKIVKIDKIDKIDKIVNLMVYGTVLAICRACL